MGIDEMELGKILGQLLDGQIRMDKKLDDLAENGCAQGHSDRERINALERKVSNGNGSSNGFGTLKFGKLQMSGLAAVVGAVVIAWLFWQSIQTQGLRSTLERIERNRLDRGNDVTVVNSTTGKEAQN